MVTVFMVDMMNYLFNRRRWGTVEAVKSTYGKQGQYLLTISGVEYNVWLDFSKVRLYKGDRVEHLPFTDFTLGKALKTTTIYKIIGNFNVTK